MLRRLLILFVALCWAGSLAMAGEGDKKEKKPEPGMTVEMPFLVAPLVKDGDLLGYAYIASKLTCSSPNACMAVREKLAFIQDAYVREVNAKSVSLASDPKQVDKDQLSARLTAAARKIVGGNKVVGMMIVEIKIKPLHPSDMTAPDIPPDQAAAQEQAAAAAAEGAKKGKSQGATSKPAPEAKH